MLRNWFSTSPEKQQQVTAVADMNDKIVLQTELDDNCDKLQWSSIGGIIINFADQPVPSVL